MFDYDFIDSTTTETYDAEKAYAAYWAVATSESYPIANGRGPVYRFARNYMLAAVMHDYRLTVAEVAWLYNEVLSEGPGWGDLGRMVNYGLKRKFGRITEARRVLDCYECRESVRTGIDAESSAHHAIDCPFRDDTA